MVATPLMMGGSSSETGLAHKASASCARRVLRVLPAVAVQHRKMLACKVL